MVKPWLKEQFGMIINKKYFNNYFLFIRILSFVLLIALWEFVALVSDKTIFPSLINIFETLINEISEGELFFHLGMTLYRVFVAFFFAMIIGTFIGILMGKNRKVDQFLDSWNILFLNIISIRM